MSFTETTTPATARPTAAAAGVLEHLEQSWNAADGAAFGRVFTPDCDFVDVRGDHHQGAQAVANGHQGIFDSIYRGSVVAYSTESAREVAPGVVVAVAAGRLECPSGPLRGVNLAHLTLVLVEQAGEWRVAAFQNTLQQSRP